MTVVDPLPVNWLSIAWNTMEEMNRVDENGIGQPSLASGWRWIDDETLKIDLRQGVVDQDGEKFDAKLFKTGFDKVQDLEDPHPPGAFLNFHPGAKVEVANDHQVRMTFPGID